MIPAVTAAVHLAAGTGHVVRRPESLLFLPEPDDTVRAAFLAAAPGDELQAVASATVAAGFDVGRYVCVAWRRPARVMVFGDVAVETDQASVPMFTGAGSRTWVEQTVPVDGTVTIRVATGVDEADDVTDLRDGTAHAAGFVLALSTAGDGVELPADEIVPLTPDAADADGADPTTVLPAPTGLAPDPSLPDPSGAAPAIESPPEETMAPPPSTDGEPDLPPQRPTPHAVPSDVARDPALALAAIQAAAMNDEGEPVQRSEPAQPAEPAPMASVELLERGPVDHLDDDHTLPPPAAGELLADLDTDGRGALVEAKLCPDGHANPPMVAMCGICRALLSPSPSAVTHVRRPSLGSLRLDDGNTIELDDELLIGRNPARDEQATRADLRRVQVVGDKVSRSHVELRFQGWDVMVVDCVSTNGTFVVPHPGGQVVALEPGRGHLVEPGAVVYFGSRSFTVVERRR